MKPVLLLCALLLGSLASSCQASGFFAGVEASPYAAWKDCYLYVWCQKDRATDGSSQAAGIRAGYWVTSDDASRQGIEIGYDKFTAVSGSSQWFPNGCGVFCNPPSATATWKNEGELLYADWIGYARAGSRSWGLLFKGGLFASSVNTEGDYGLGGGTYHRRVNGGGVLLGTGGIIPLSEHISIRAAFDMFFNVKVAVPTSTTGTLSDSLFNFSLGVDYAF